MAGWREVKDRRKYPPATKKYFRRLDYVKANTKGGNLGLARKVNEKCCKCRGKTTLYEVEYERFGYCCYDCY